MVGTGYGRYARHITGYALFDRVDTLVASAAAWKRLSQSQQTAIRAAARDTVGFTATLADRDAENLAQLCRRGVHVTTPTAAEPARDRRDDRAGARRRCGGTRRPRRSSRSSRRPREPVHAPCRCRRTAARRTTRRRRLAAEPATIPEGTYVVRFTAADAKRHNLYGSDWEKPFVVTTRFKHGRWKDLTGIGSGTYSVDGDTAHFRMLQPADAPPPWTVKWSYYNGALSFELVDVADAGLRMIFGARPWRRVE